LRASWSWCGRRRAAGPVPSCWLPSAPAIRISATTDQPARRCRRQPHRLTERAQPLASEPAHDAGRRSWIRAGPRLPKDRAGCPARMRQSEDTSRETYPAALDMAIFGRIADCLLFLHPTIASQGARAAQIVGVGAHQPSYAACWSTGHTVRFEVCPLGSDLVRRVGRNDLGAHGGSGLDLVRACPAFPQVRGLGPEMRRTD
jgi:hypothetical protein